MIVELNYSLTRRVPITHSCNATLCSYRERGRVVVVQPDFLLSSKSDLISLLRRYSPQGGLAIKPLRDSWSGVTQAIEELEKEGRVLVTRTDGKGDAGGKGQMKCVFLDDIGREKEPLDKGEL